LNIKGFSGPYVQYSLVRVVSILQKVLGVQTESVQELLGLASEEMSKKSAQKMQPITFTDDEKELVSLLTNYYQTIAKATQNYAPHLICDYLYNVATHFNSFYAHEAILGNPKRELITVATGWVLEQGLKLLGMKSLVKM
jgi:arginyl-tRNA synthetase